MRALVPGEIDQLGSFADSTDRGFLNGLALANQGDDAAIVIGVHLAVEQVDAGDLHRVDDGIHARFVAALGKVRNAFHQRRHNEEEYRLQLE